MYSLDIWIPLQWCHKEPDGVSNHRRLDSFLNRLFRCGSMKTSWLRVTGLCEGNSPVTDGFPSKRANNAENASIWWRHYKWCYVFYMWTMWATYLDDCFMSGWQVLYIWTTVKWISWRRVLHIWTIASYLGSKCYIFGWLLHIWTIVTYLDGNI